MTEDVHPPILAQRELFNDPDETSEFERVTLAGPTCDSADVIARDYPMPALDIGDVVISPMMAPTPRSRRRGSTACPPPPSS